MGDTDDTTAATEALTDNQSPPLRETYHPTLAAAASTTISMMTTSGNGTSTTTNNNHTSSSDASSIVSSFGGTGTTGSSVTTESSASTLTHSTFPTTATATLAPDPPSPMISRLDSKESTSEELFSSPSPPPPPPSSTTTHHMPTINSMMSEIAALQQAMQRMEVKYEYTLASTNQQWRTKFQRMEASVSEQGRKLQATQRLLQESHAPLLTQLTKLVQKQQVAIQQQHVHQHEQRHVQTQQQAAAAAAEIRATTTLGVPVANVAHAAISQADDRSTNTFTSITSTSSTAARDPEGHVIHKRKDPQASTGTSSKKATAKSALPTLESSANRSFPTLTGVSHDDLRAEVEHCLAQREQAWVVTQQQVEAQASQLTTLEVNVQTVLNKHESLRYDQVQMKQSIATNAELQLAQGQKMDDDMQILAESMKHVLRIRQQALVQEAKLAKDRSVTPTNTAKSGKTSPAPVADNMEAQVCSSPLINLCHLTDVPLDSATHKDTVSVKTASGGCDTSLCLLKKECFHLIHQENERMMHAWGTQFDDLAVYLQDNLDAQRTSITDARTSTFDHVDAEAKLRTAAAQAQSNELATKVNDQAKQIQEQRDDQEKSLIIVVEALMKLKKKVEEMTDQQTTQETLQLSSDVDMQKILRIIETKTKEWNLSFRSYETELTKVKEELRLLSTETDAMAEDREAIQEILDESLALFTSNSNTTAELWNVQFQKLERQMKLLDYEKLLSELSKVMEAWKRKFADVMRLYNHQAKELAIVQSRLDNARNGDENRDAFSDYLEMRRKKVTFSDIKVDQKKYKKVLWQAKQNRCAAKGGDASDPEVKVTPTNDIQYYDLTFALSTEQ